MLCSDWLLVLFFPPLPFSEVVFGVDAVNSEKDLGFARRMEDVAKLVGNATLLAQKTAISRRAIGLYMSGEADPTLKKLVAIARAAGVCLEWLATGNGPKFHNQDGPASQCDSSVDTKRLKAVLSAVKEAITDGGYKVSPSQEAEIISGIYELIKSEDQIPKTAIIHFLASTTK